MRAPLTPKQKRVKKENKKKKRKKKTKEAETIIANLIKRALSSIFTSKTLDALANDQKKLQSNIYVA